MIDFDQLVTQACINGLGVPVAIQAHLGAAPISTLSDGVTPLLGIWERAMREMRDDPKTGALMVVAKPQLGMSAQHLASAGITLGVLNSGSATIAVLDPATGNTETWKIALAEGPDSGGSVKISLLVISL